MAGAGHALWWTRALEEAEAAHTLRTTGKRLQAYQLAGQAVEFALKAIYIKRRGLAELPDSCKGANWHNLTFIAMVCARTCVAFGPTGDDTGTGSLLKTGKMISGSQETSQALEN